MSSKCINYTHPIVESFVCLPSSQECILEAYKYEWYSWAVVTAGNKTGKLLPRRLIESWLSSTFFYPKVCCGVPHTTHKLAQLRASYGHCLFCDLHRYSRAGFSSRTSVLRKTVRIWGYIFSQENTKDELSTTFCSFFLGHRNDSFGLNTIAMYVKSTGLYFLY